MPDPGVPTTAEELSKLGEAIDNATDASDIAAPKSLDVRTAAFCTEENSSYASYLWYFRSNIHAAIQDIQDRRSWQWRQLHRERQILYLRRAIKQAKFIRLPYVMQA